MRRSLRTFLAVAACATWATSSLAQTSAEADNIQKARFKEGMAHYEKQEYEAARLAFLQAYAAKPTDRILWNLAVSEHRSAHDIEALEHFRKYLKSPTVSEADRAKADAMSQEAKKQVGELVISAPADATTLVDGARIDELDVFVKPGDHAVLVKLAGATKTNNVAVAAAQRVALEFTFEPAKTPPVESTKATPASATSPTADTPPPADHPRGEPSRTKWIAGGSLAVLGVTGIALGAGFGLGSQGASNDAAALEQSHACSPPGTSAACSQLHSKLDDKSTKTTISWTSYGIGGVALGAAAVVLYLAWTEDKARTSWVVPVVSRETAGVGWVHSF